MAKKEKKTITQKLDDSPINYFSDLFVVAMVVAWIVVIIIFVIVGIIQTATMINLSYQVGMNCVDSSIWSSLETLVSMPLSAGGAIWMIKNTVQHNIANKKGKRAHMDFPSTETYIENEPEMFADEEDTEIDTPVGDNPQA